MGGRRPEQLSILELCGMVPADVESPSRGRLVPPGKRLLVRYLLDDEGRVTNLYHEVVEADTPVAPAEEEDNGWSEIPCPD